MSLERITGGGAFGEPIINTINDPVNGVHFNGRLQKTD